MRFSRVANVFAWPRAHVSLGSEDVVVFLSVATSRELGKAVAQFGPMKLNDVCDSRLYENPFTYRAEADRHGSYLVLFQVLTPAWFGTVPRQ